MVQKMLLLNNMRSVKAFTAIAGEKDYAITLSAGEKTVDAKVITEVFRLDLTKPVQMTADTNKAAELCRQIAAFEI